MALLYFFLIPFVSAFNVSTVVVLPLVGSCVAIVWRTLTFQRNSTIYTQSDWFALIFLVVVGCSTIVNIDNMDSKNLNHLLAIFSSFYFFYFGIQGVCSRISFSVVLRVLFWAYMFSTVFAIVEFYLVNVMSYDIGAFVPRPMVLEYSPLFLGGLFVRSRSLFEESGHYASYLAVLIPIMCHYLWNLQSSRFARIAFIVMTVGAVFTTFSVSMFVFFPVAVAAGVLVSSYRNGRVGKQAIFVLCILGFVISAILLSDELRESVLTAKFSSDSFDDRNEKFIDTIKLMSTTNALHAMIGFGPGSYAFLSVRPAISVYLNFLRDFGGIGVIAYLCFCAASLRDLLRQRGPLGVSLFVSGLIGQLFFTAIPDYYYPHFFLPLLLYKILLWQDGPTVIKSGRPSALRAQLPA